MGSDATDKRIVDLELRYMRMEKTLNDLSDVLVAQQRTIDRLVTEVRSLRERMPEDAGDARANDPPPHY